MRSNEIFHIKQELELIKNELLHRLFSEPISSTDIEQQHSIFEETNKHHILVEDMQNDLYDIEIALQKIDHGLFGYCEVTGQAIPIEKLKVLPTGRTLEDFSFVRNHY
ncbi:TraR/DksA family transcriptional regulator [Gottfriedia acidiceleris]|uniref:TraR/DksA family transcriptional regulator n=1 Tax=Gottfriedia acidiceleris TaxID=371036 RepID=A0ABY4JJ44_9BACI|nr:TraR/DksA family transcriptional regulator [Gottfriedia acidiceleris]UPM53124.1 TraR/DksA family transcriptional regulator [Gottfriedia acidiceleris]